MGSTNYLDARWILYSGSVIREGGLHYSQKIDCKRLERDVNAS